MSRKAFTLIELLVVIAIIAILAAILFPVFASAREKARQITCASNEKQIGLAWLQYSEDYDEYYPENWVRTCNPNGDQLSWYPADCPGGIHESDNKWAGALYPYVKSTGVFMCPDDSLPTAYAGGNINSYEENANFNYVYGAWGGLNQAKLNAPSLTVLLYENQGAASQDPATCGWNFNQTCSTGGIQGGYDCTSWANYGYDVEPAASVYGLIATAKVSSLNGAGDLGGCVPNNPYGAPSAVVGGPTVHSYGSNFLACDGHVKWLRPEQVSPGNYGGAPPTGSTMSEVGICSSWQPAGTANMTQTQNGTGPASPVSLTFNIF